MTQLAKISSKNQITLPIEIVRSFPGAEYFDVALQGGVIVLTPLKLRKKVSALEEARASFKAKGYDENTITEAVRWARKGGK